MTRRTIITVAVCALAMCAALAGPVAGASASKRSIVLALKSYSGRILTSEGHVVSALGEYKTSKNPAPAEAALGEAVTVLKGLRAKVAAQGAPTPRVKEAKVKIEEGLHAVIVAYTSLSSALADKASDPGGASAEAEKFVAAAKKGSKELHQGAVLLRS